VPSTASFPPSDAQRSDAIPAVRAADRRSKGTTVTSRSMDHEVTSRDRIWAAILREVSDGDAVSISTVRQEIHFDHRPSDEEIRRVLRAGVDIGAIEETPSGYYTLAD